MFTQKYLSALWSMIVIFATFLGVLVVLVSIVIGSEAFNALLAGASYTSLLLVTVRLRFLLNLVGTEDQELVSPEEVAFYVILLPLAVVAVVVTMTSTLGILVSSLIAAFTAAFIWWQFSPIEGA